MIKMDVYALIVFNCCPEIWTSLQCSVPSENKEYQRRCVAWWAPKASCWWWRLLNVIFRVSCFSFAVSCFSFTSFNRNPQKQNKFFHSVTSQISHSFDYSMSVRSVRTGSAVMVLGSRPALRFSLVLISVEGQVGSVVTSTVMLAFLWNRKLCVKAVNLSGPYGTDTVSVSGWYPGHVTCKDMWHTQIFTLKVILAHTIVLKAFHIKINIIIYP